MIRIGSCGPHKRLWNGQLVIVAKHTQIAPEEVALPKLQSSEIHVASDWDWNCV